MFLTMTSAIDMENHKANILDILGKIASLSFQEAVWVKSTYWDRILNYVEAINTLGDYQFYELIKTGKIAFENENDRVLVFSFIADILDYEEPTNPEDMLADPVWQSIAQRAERVRQLIDKNPWKGSD